MIEIKTNVDEVGETLVNLAVDERRAGALRCTRGGRHAALDRADDLLDLLDVLHAPLLGRKQVVGVDGHGDRLGRGLTVPGEDLLLELVEIRLIPVGPGGAWGRRGGIRGRGGLVEGALCEDGGEEVEEGGPQVLPGLGEQHPNAGAEVHVERHDRDHGHGVQVHRPRFHFERLPGVDLDFGDGEMAGVAVLGGCRFGSVFVEGLLVRGLQTRDPEPASDVQLVPLFVRELEQGEVLVDGFAQVVDLRPLVELVPLRKGGAPPRERRHLDLLHDAGGVDVDQRRDLVEKVHVVEAPRPELENKCQ